MGDVKILATTNAPFEFEAPEGVEVVSIDEDQPILRMLWAERSHDSGLRAFGLGPKHGAEILQRMAQSGRLYPATDASPLRLAEARPATVSWRLDINGRQRPCLKAQPEASHVVPLDPPWYVDLAEGETGPLQVAGNPARSEEHT